MWYRGEAAGAGEYEGMGPDPGAGAGEGMGWGLGEAVPGVCEGVWGDLVALPLRMAGKSAPSVNEGVDAAGEAAGKGEGEAAGKGEGEG